MNRMKLIVSLLTLAFAATPAKAAEDQADMTAVEPAASPADAIAGGGGCCFNCGRDTPTLIRPIINTDAADAYTMRTLLGWQTRPWKDLAGTVQLLNVGHLGPEHYATSSAQPSRYPLIRDADITDVNSLYIDYAGITKTALRIGRQDLILDNERMVGVKNLSKTPQVFDAVTLKNQFLPATDLSLGHFWRERTTSTTDLRSNTSLLNVRVSYAERSSLAGYAYSQDQPDTGQTTGFKDNSNRITGLRLNGAQPIREM